MSDAPLAIGIDFGGTTVKIGIVADDHVLGETIRLDTQEYESAPPLIQTLADIIISLQAKHPQVTAVGLGMPGFVDFPTGRVHNLTNVRGWQNIQLKRDLEALIDLPVSVDNDANCMAIAEWKRGAGLGCHHLLALTLGTGVGGGLVINDCLIRGANSVAGELGQISIDHSGAPGAYGNKGALEDFIGNRQITQLAFEAYLTAKVPKEREECEPDALAQAAILGDAIALNIWEQVAGKLASALMSYCYLLNPELIIIGGGVAKAGRLIFDPLEAKLHAQLSAPFKDHLKIVPAKFGNEAGIIGAATLALEAAGFDVVD